MSAPAFQSVQVSGGYTLVSGTRTVTKPTSLAVGDLMIAYGIVTSTSAPSFPAGFSVISDIGTISVNPARSRVAFKIADSSDVAATNFSIETCGFASISRITGAVATSSAVVTSQTAQLNSASFTGTGLTPLDRDDDVLLMMFLSFANGSSGTIANYAIATSNPSWSERYNVTPPDSGGAALATSTRPEMTATGNFTADGAGSASADWVGHLIAVPVPATPVTVSETATLTEGVGEAVGKTISDTATLTENVSSNPQRFSNQSKNSSTVTNQTKNDSTFTDQTKNSSNWSNQSKN